MKRTRATRPVQPPRALATEVASQFQGMEIEFDDKVTLFPVQVEKRPGRRRAPVRSLRR